MMKRMLSMLLCLVMVLSMVPSTVLASDTVDTGTDDVYIEEGSSVTVSDDGTVAETEPSDTVEVFEPSEEGFQTGSSPMVDTSTTGSVPCDCGTGAEELISHSDACAQKRFCIDLCAKNAMDIYTQWYSISVAERAFIKEYLALHYSDTLDMLQKIWNGDQITDENDSLTDMENPGLPERPTGEATAQVGDIIVDAEGIPEGSSLTVADATKKATRAVETEVDGLGKNPEQLFLYDISVQNEESDDWQPEGTSVHMELTIPDVKLHKHAIVYVLHVDDQGNTSTLEAKVTEDGAIAFDTEGFSTFAGFTVDFEYGIAFYSIQGLTDITLSELFDNLQMPLYASDAVNVTFTDYSLVSVSQLEGDWLLTSLQAFNTKEILTITMKDGTVYEIRVTDRVVDQGSPEIIVGGGGFDGVNEDYYDHNDNNEVVWYADQDGYMEEQSEMNSDIYHNDGWSRTSTVYVGGEGEFTIRIQPYSNVYPSKWSKTTCYVRIQQIRVLNKAHLKFILGGNFDSTNLTTCQIFGTDANMFLIEDGAKLSLQGRNATSTKGICYLVLDGRGGGTQDGGLVNTKDNQAVRLDNATYFFAQWVRFQDCPRSAIKVRNSNGGSSTSRMTQFIMNRCIFDGDVRRESDTNTGSGGAIYVEDVYNSNYTWIDEFGLSNCQFNGTYAAESGGALGFYGRVKYIHLTSCHFNDTYAKSNYGGAIVMAGHVGEMLISGCTFTNNSAPLAGGSIYFVSRVIIAANGTYSRLNKLTITSCSFKNSGTIANSQTINSALGGAMSIDTSIHTLSITGCYFTDLKATEGAGICFGYTNMPLKPDGSVPAFMSNEHMGTNENATKVPPGAEGTDGSEYYRTSIGATTISNCDFTRCKGDTQGGAFRVRTNSTVKSLSMDDVNFYDCEAVQAGSAIMLGDCIIPTLTYTNSTIKNCKTTMTETSEVGGTFRTIGKTTCNASLTNITFQNNSSHCSGGGVYWNASGVRYIWSDTPITTQIALNQCTFDGNKAGWYGGGVYCEAKMTVAGCEFKNNVSVDIGGGIALQLYNNTVRPFTNNEITTLTLDADTTIHHNQSRVGGGISVRCNASQALANDLAYGHSIQFNLGGAQVYNNYATEDGGGVWFNVESYDTSTEGGAGDQQEVERFNKAINLASGSIYDNTAGRHGGGVFMNGGTVTDPEVTTTGQLNSNGTVEINLSGAAIYGNEAGRSCTGVTASAYGVYPPVITVTKGTDGNIAFTKSTATSTGGNGGGIYLYGNVAVCNLTGGVVGATKGADGKPATASSNIATRSPDGANGGTGGGVAIFGQGRIEMNGGYVVNNKSDTAGGGIAVHDSSSMWFYGSGVVENNQSCMGGGISLNAAKPLDKDSEVDAEKYGMLLDGGTVKSNKVAPDSSNNNYALGGGICISASSTMKVNGGEISYNIAATDPTAATLTYAAGQEGGGIAVCQTSTMEITGGTIKNNKAYDGGGLLLRGSATVNMTGSVVIISGVVDSSSAKGILYKNYAYHDGGGAYIGTYLVNGVNTGNVNKFTMNSGWIHENEADTGNGGAVNVTKYNGFYLKGGVVEDNTAEVNGGGIYASQAAIEVTNGFLQDNTATTAHGGGIYAYDTSVKISNGTIQNNTATVGEGGGIYFEKNTLKLYGENSGYGKLLSNTAGSYGGAISAKSSATVEISDGLIQGNNATEGGGIYAQKSTVDISNGTIKSNTASSNGGGVRLSGTSKLKLYGTGTTYGQLLSNTATKKGGAVYAGSSSEVEISNGNIDGNTANAGGGVYAGSAKLTISNGIIQNNKTTGGSGGGICCENGSLYLSGTATAYSSILNNQAYSGCGGGIFGKNMTDIDIDYLKLEGNAGKYGGGMYVEYCNDVTINGGIFNQNYSNQGAGLFVRSGGTVINGGEFTNNRAGSSLKYTSGPWNGQQMYANDTSAQHGGGIVVDHMLYGTTATVTINGGTVSGNEAPYGGGIWFKNFFDVSNDKSITVNMYGGTVTDNTAKDGGGLYIAGVNSVIGEPKTFLNIYGGDISENVATGKGGGVFAHGLVDVQIVEDTEKNTHGTIDSNTAYCGGGVSVSGGADLTVNNGYITHNTATIPSGKTPAASGYQGYDNLYGTGGGVFVASGLADAPSTFTLTGNSMAIYGNKAGHAADDVFSSGGSTKLDVPLVNEMDLAGYGFQPEGWFEDYNPKDTNYATDTATGLNMLAANGAPDDVTVERYRSSNGTQRLYMHINPNNSDGNNYVRGNMDVEGADEAAYNYANKLGAYVCMTLGIPSAVDDTVVIDFSRPVNINVQENDIFITEGDFADSSATADGTTTTTNHSYVGQKRPDTVQEKDGIYYNLTRPVTDNAFYKSFRGNTRGLVYNSRNGNIKYTPETLMLSGVFQFVYVVEHNTVWYYGTVSVIPAASIYFEDNLTGKNSVSIVKYHTNDDVKTYTDDSGNEVRYDTLAEWTTVGDSISGNQSQDRPGPSVSDTVDRDNVYGYDGYYHSYKNITYSGGSAHKVTVNRHAVTGVNGQCSADCDMPLYHDWLDTESDGYCDRCGNNIGHYCKQGTDAKCTICGHVMNGVCDVENCVGCARYHGLCTHWADANNDGICDKDGCNKKNGHHCADSDSNGNCDTCRKAMAHTCVDQYKSGHCEICGLMTFHTVSARASFTFSGTGFDIISYCSAQTGILMVNVYSGEITDFDDPELYKKCVATYMVDTYYGYTGGDADDPGAPDTSSTAHLYQVPVIKADLTKVMIQMDDPNTPDVDESVYEDYGYGTYTVELYIAPSFLEREQGYWGSEFYLDAIRVYNPIGVGYSNGAKYPDAEAAYEADGEAWPEYYELRNLFISPSEIGKSYTGGTVFIDGDTTPVVSQYQSWGPNNEIYLAPGKSVAFYLDASEDGLDFASNVASVQLGVRGLTGKGYFKVQAKPIGGEYENVITTKSVYATDLYFDISQKDADGNLGIANKVILIHNPSTVSGVTNTVPIAITNIKVTHYSEPAVANAFSTRIMSNEDTVLAAYEILTAGDLAVDPVVTPKRPALSFNGMISYNVFYSAENLGDLTGADLGLAVFSTEDPEGTVETAREVIYGAEEIDGLYMTSTSGINAKYLGDKQYFKVFAKKADGSIVYSKMVSYSAVDYAKNVLAKSEDVKLKQLVIAMLNYGAAAQQFFGYKTDDLMNKDLTADDQALLAGFDATSLNSAIKVDADKVGAFASTGGFSKKSPAISFNGAFEINYFFTPANPVDGAVRLFIWSEDTYNSVTELTAENADEEIYMICENGSYTASSPEIAAKYLDKTVFVAAVYEYNGVSYCSGVLPYSIAAYCQKPPAGVEALATAAAIYGCTAKQYFAV